MVQEPSCGVPRVGVRLQFIPRLLRRGEGEFVGRDDGDAEAQALVVGVLDHLGGGGVVDQDRAAGTVGEPVGDGLGVDVFGTGGREVVAPVVEGDG